MLDKFPGNIDAAGLRTAVLGLLVLNSGGEMCWGQMHPTQKAIKTVSKLFWVSGGLCLLAPFLVDTACSPTGRLDLGMGDTVSFLCS